MLNNASQSVLCGLHVGHASLHGVALSEQGELLHSAQSRFRGSEGLEPAFEEVVESLSRALDPAEIRPLWTLALEKIHRPILAPRRLDIPRPALIPDIVQPALSSVLLGAIPDRPGLLLNLGREVRIALIDSTLTYREYRFTEGGGEWWRAELQRLAEHSLRLQTHLKQFPEGQPGLRNIPQLLELGQYPTPDPVLKPRLEKMASQLTQMVIRATARLPGMEDYALSGYLGKSSFGRMVARRLNEEAPYLRERTPRFPPEVGAALSGLAQEKENWEREHLGKELFNQDRTQDEWAPPRELVRRLYRLRKPFERFPS